MSDEDKFRRPTVKEALIILASLAGNPRLAEDLANGEVVKFE